jgi:hypothetical protein
MGTAAALAVGGLWLTCLADPGAIPAAHEPGNTQQHDSMSRLLWQPIKLELSISKPSSSAHGPTIIGSYGDRQRLRC